MDFHRLRWLTTLPDGPFLKIIGFMGKKGKGKRRELCRLPFSMKKMNALAAYLPNKYSDVKQTKCIMR